MSAGKKERHGGNRGVWCCAGIGNGSGRDHIAAQPAELFLAQIAAYAAKAQLDALSTNTEFPPRGVVEAADLLDAVLVALGRRP